MDFPCSSSPENPSAAKETIVRFKHTSRGRSRLHSASAALEPVDLHSIWVSFRSSTKQLEQKKIYGQTQASASGNVLITYYTLSINDIPESKNCQPWPWKAKLPQFRRRQELTKKLFAIKSNSQTLLHSIGQVTTRAQRGSGVGLQLLVLRKWGERPLPSTPSLICQSFLVHPRLHLLV